MVLSQITQNDSTDYATAWAALLRRTDDQRAQAFASWPASSV